MNFEQYLGYRGTDKITGFSGVILSYQKDLTGCEYFLIIPEKMKPQYVSYGFERVEISSSTRDTMPEQKYIDCHRVAIGEKLIDAKEVTNPKLLK